MKENVFPTRRSVVATLSLNKTCAYLNVHLKNEYYPKAKVIYASYVKKGRHFYLIINKTKVDGLRSFSRQLSGGFCCSQPVYFEGLKANDIVRYRLELVDTDIKLKGAKVFKLIPYAIDAVRSVEYFNFKVKI